MDPLIRAAALSQEPRRLQRREDRIATKAVAAPLSAPVAAPPPAATVDPEAQRAWQQRAEQELLAARQREERAGHAAGHAKGLAEAQGLHKDKLQHLDQLIENAGRSFTAQVDGLEDIAVGIAFESLVKLLGDALVTREGVQAVVSQVLERTKQQEKLVVRLSPNDFYLLLQQRSDTTPLLTQQGVELVPDDRIELGGCLVETSAGSLDARLETQMLALRQVLLRARSERGGRAEAG